LQSKDLKNLLKNFGISFDNDLNKATYGVTAAQIHSDADGNKVPRTPAEVTIFSDAVARFCVRQ
jgi:predicted RNase H-like nuclease (RuvC/YqgF family)